MDKVWRAFYTKPRHEIKIKERLEEAGHKIYCPVVKTKVRWSDRWKKVTKPAMPGYLFAKVDEPNRMQVLQDPSVLHTVMWNKKFVEISDEEIEFMQLILDDAEEIAPDDVHEGDRVEIARGSLAGQSGIVVKLSNKAVYLRIDTMQCEMTVNVPMSRIEKIRDKMNKKT